MTCGKLAIATMPMSLLLELKSAVVRSSLEESKMLRTASAL